MQQLFGCLASKQGIYQSRSGAEGLKKDIFWDLHMEIEVDHVEKDH
jgi:hypothetical protein